MCSRNALGAHLKQQRAKPLLLGRVRLPNRVLMGSMHTNLEEAPNGYARMAAFFAERARGGAGLMVTVYLRRPLAPV